MNRLSKYKSVFWKSLPLNIKAGISAYKMPNSVTKTRDVAKKELSRIQRADAIRGNLY